MNSERGLVERVTDVLQRRPDARPQSIREARALRARAIIEEVAEAMEEAFKSGGGVNPALNEGPVWADWLRRQAQESEE